MTDCFNRTAGLCSSGYCCGSSPYYPVYINPELTGCWTPRIPGYASVDSALNIKTYYCAATPTTLIGGPKVLLRTDYAPSRTVSTSPVPIVDYSTIIATTFASTTYSSGAFAYVPWGCLSTPAAALTTSDGSWKNLSDFAWRNSPLNLYNKPLYVPDCIAACDFLSGQLIILDKGK